MKPVFVVVGLCVFALAFRAEFSAGQQPPAVSKEERQAVVDVLSRKITEFYVYAPVAERMVAALRQHQANHDYDAIANGAELAQRLTADLKSISHDGHLGVEFTANPQPAAEDKGPSPQDIAAFRLAGQRNNYGFRKGERLEGNVGLLQLDSFYPADLIRDTAAGVMAFLANSDAIIIDLRKNHGFAPDGVLLIESYFFEEATHITDQMDRDAKSTRQFWTMPAVPGPNLAGKDLYILTSHDTFSAPEDFSYNLQALKRSQIVGETTGGGAHGTKPYWLTEHFSASIPFSYSVNPVTHTDWEGVGVKPDIAVPADQALLAAQLAALRKISARAVREPQRVASLQTVIAAKQQELEAMSQKGGAR
jgi:hypothetical protein